MPKLARHYPIFNTETPENLSNNLMLDFINAGDCFTFRILNPNELIDNGLVDANEHLLVDGRTEDETVIFRVIRRKISATTTQWNTKRSTCNYHGFTPT